jgi:hypothetical protein
MRNNQTSSRGSIARSGENNIRLREIMREYGLTRREVCELLHKAVTDTGQTPAVNKWLAKPTDLSNYRAMSDADLELLELKLAKSRPRK